MSDNELIESFRVANGHKPTPLADISFYESDWNMIMAAVSICRQLQRGKWHDRTRTLYVDIEIALGEVRITQTHRAVVEWIKWYNQAKQS